jgi:hypothetical protein
MLGPKIERLALLGRVGGAVVDSGDASLVAADMIEHRFDNMRQYSKFDNPGGDRAADVMQSPGLQFVLALLQPWNSPFPTAAVPSPLASAFIQR